MKVNISDKQLRALTKIIKLFKENNISNEWIISGGISHKIQGLDIETIDIDILTNTSLAFEMGQALKEYSVNNVKVCGNDKFHSAFGQFEIDGVPVEIAGDLVIKGEFKYPISITQQVLKKCVQVTVDDYNINLEPLEESLIADSLLGRQKRVSKIIDKLKEKDVDWNYINDRLNQVKETQSFKEVLNGYFKKESHTC